MKPNKTFGLIESYFRLNPVRMRIITVANVFTAPDITPDVRFRTIRTVANCRIVAGVDYPAAAVMAQTFLLG